MLLSQARHTERFSGALDVAATDSVADNAICAPAADHDHDDDRTVASADATVDVDIPRIITKMFIMVKSLESRDETSLM